MNPYLKARNDLLKTIREDLVGPENENEIISESPTTRYSSGVLFPRERKETTTDTELTADRNLQAGDDRPMDEEEADGLIEQTSSFYPSAMGLSFIVDTTCSELLVKISAGKYQHLEDADYPISIHAPDVKSIPDDAEFAGYLKYSEGVITLKKTITKDERDILINKASENAGLKNAIYRVTNYAEQGWKRIPVYSEMKINPKLKYQEYEIRDEHLKIISTSKTDPENGQLICSVTAVNSETAARQMDNEKSYFQISLTIGDQEGSRPFHAFNGEDHLDNSDPELESLRLLYRKKLFFAAGHGTSAEWNNASGNRAGIISVNHLPSSITPEINFELSADRKDLPNLSMRHLAMDSKQEILNSLNKLLLLYNNWINNLEKESVGLENIFNMAASEHIKLCREAALRIEKGISLLDKNSGVMNSFRLANKAMLMQRVHTKAQENEQRHFSDENFSPDFNYQTDDHVWRPFQIAFVLLNLDGIVSSKSEDRDMVDLIWFPTGGGKTEAYLGLTAFTIFMRRMDKEKSGGTTVIMRYTLRLLTSQQFQRACTLICACEKLRRDGECQGEPITIGQWLGSASSPNSLKDAEEKLEDLIGQRDGTGKNPFQILHCPWCGTYMVRKEGRGYFSYRIRSNPKRFEMWCANKACNFHDVLPLKVVDEDIYREPPTLLFGTVDKFAMLAWKAEASSIFALNPDNNNRSPELIIQDELHLISGSLGTMVGLYETAIDLLCSHKGIRPKIIASTATIRRSGDQCKALYARSVRQFPAPGLDASDSFFARESEITEKNPGRLYVGVMPSGKTSTTMEIRLLADCIQGVNLLDKETIDKFWTQVVYCNSIRELGTSKSIIYDDVKEYSKRLSDRLGIKPRYYSDKAVEELTSRVPAETIPEILQKLEINYPSKEAVDILLATNMISVGVDINRLGLMTILGQPKTTSEYIQASSRVGRRYPGLVLTLYSPVKSRDRSHFEQFLKYHQALYQYVEPTSVTPFSPPVRDKALHAILIILIRHLLGYAKNESLTEFDVNSEKMKSVIEEIMSRVNIVDPAEAGPTRTELNNILSKIDELKNLDSGISYDNLRGSEKIPLLRRPNDKSRGIYSTPQSMRSTDAECFVTMDYS